MPTTDPGVPALAEQLLDAQVRHHLAQLTGEQLEQTVAVLADDVLQAGGRHQLADLVDREALTAIVVRSLATVPGSAAVGGFVELAMDVAYDDAVAAYPLGEVVERERVEALVDAALALTPVLERALERLTVSPLATTMASRFMGRIVGEVLQANKAVADKVPGLGSLMSLGTSTASKVMGAADKQFEGLIGGTVGKGGTFAARGLNRIIIETLQDPTTKEALLQVWDMVAAERVTEVDSRVAREELTDLVDAVHAMTTSVLAGEHVGEVVSVVVDAFFERFGGYTPLELLDELDIAREDIVADLVAAAPPVVDALRESGDLERLVRAQLEPFYASAEVAELLEAHT